MRLGAMYVDWTWRVGRKVGRTIYAVRGEASDSDPLIGVMDTPALASAVVEAHNEALEIALSALPAHGPHTKDRDTA